MLTLFVFHYEYFLEDLVFWGICLKIVSGRTHNVRNKSVVGNSYLTSSLNSAITTHYFVVLQQQECCSTYTAIDLNTSVSLHRLHCASACLHPKDRPEYNSYTNPPHPCVPVCVPLVPLVIIHCKSSPLVLSAICLPHISSGPSGLSQFPR